MNLKTLLELRHKLIPDLKADAVAEFMKEVKEDIGLDLEQLLGSVGTDWVSFDPGGRECYSALPGMAASVSVKDEVLVKRLLKEFHAKQIALADEHPERSFMFRVKREPFAIAGHDTYSLRVSMLPMSPCVAVAHGRLLVAVSERSMRLTLEQLSAPGKSILDTPEFQAAVQRITSAPFDGQRLPPFFSFCNPDHAEHAWYIAQDLGHVFQSAAFFDMHWRYDADNPEQDFQMDLLEAVDPFRLPPLQTVQAFWKPTAAGLATSDQGLILRYELALPSGAMFASGQTQPLLLALVLAEARGPGGGRMAANEGAAVASCMAYASAQDIYRRTDWDKDTIAEYSQAIRGGQEREVKEVELPEPGQAELDAVKEWLPKMSSEEFATREEASRKLRELGTKAIKPLQDAAQGELDAETKSRIASLVKAMKEEIAGTSILDPREGLYMTANQEEIKLVDRAMANAEGPPSANPTPKAGYCFKVLPYRRSPNGEKGSFLDNNGNMTLGYAVIAYPAQYGVTGRNCFMIDNTGTVFQKDLGPDTAKLMETWDTYDVSDGWSATE